MSFTTEQIIEIPRSVEHADNFHRCLPDTVEDDVVWVSSDTDGTKSLKARPAEHSDPAEFRILDQQPEGIESGVQNTIRRIRIIGGNVGMDRIKVIPCCRRENQPAHAVRRVLALSSRRATSPAMPSPASSCRTPSSSFDSNSAGLPTWNRPCGAASVSRATSFCPSVIRISPSAGRLFTSSPSRNLASSRVTVDMLGKCHSPTLATRLLSSRIGRVPHD
jgi:hypothetical protein